MISITTMRRIFNEILRKMGRLINKLKTYESEKVDKKTEKIMEHLAAAEIEFLTLEDDETLFDCKCNDTPKKRQNICKRDDFSCVVCGLRDVSMQNLICRRRSNKEYSAAADYVTFCLPHGEKFVELLPWEERDPSGKKADELIRKMRTEGYKNENSEVA